jgi:hypothetical protein
MRRTAVADRVKLPHRPYRAPRLAVGERAVYLFCDCPVVVTGWTDARAWLRQELAGAHETCLSWRSLSVRQPPLPERLVL